MKYAFLEPEKEKPVIISAVLTEIEEQKLLKILRKYKEAIAWSIEDLKGISPSISMHKILLNDDARTSIEHQRRLNPVMKDIVIKEVQKWLNAGFIYAISDSSWVSPVHVVPKKGGFTVIRNENNELIPTRTVTGWRVCIDYRKLNTATRKDHFPLPFIDQMLDRLEGHPFLDGYSGYNQIAIEPEDQEKTTFTCPFGTFAFRRMPFSLCNAPATFQRCMMSIFSDLAEEVMEIFMDDFTVYGSSFENCLHNLGTVLHRYQDKNLALNWEKFHFMVIEGIVLGHMISEAGLEVDKVKVSIIKNLMPPIIVKGIRSFLDMLGFIEDLLETSPKLLDHYVDYWKRIPSSSLMSHVRDLLKRSNQDWLKLPSWKNKIGIKNLKSCVMPVIMQWELYWDGELTRCSGPYTMPAKLSMKLKKITLLLKRRC